MKHVELEVTDNKGTNTNMISSGLVMAMKKIVEKDGENMVPS